MNARSAMAYQRPRRRLDCRLLAPTDLDAMESLHRLSTAGMEPHLVKRESREFLDSLLSGRGTVFGALAGEQLVAYGVLQHDLLAQDDPRALLGIAPDRPLLKLAGAAVAPAWRGQALQRRLTARRIASAPPSAVLFATVSPGNCPSWRSLLGCGFAVRALEYRYGGLARYLMVYDPSALRPDTTSASAQPLDSNCLAQQQALLHAGWQGVAPGRVAGTLRLVPPVGASA